jgi:hypothetical protein
MNEADQLPARDKLCRPVNDCLQERAIGSLRRGRIEIVAGDHMIGETAHGINIVAAGEELEGAHPYVAARDAGAHGARMQALAPDVFSGGHRSQRAGGAN